MTVTDRRRCTWQQQRRVSQSATGREMMILREGDILLLGDFFRVTQPNRLVLVHTLPLAHFLLDGFRLGLLCFFFLDFLHLGLCFVVVLILLFLRLVLGRLGLLLNGHLFVNLDTT